MVDITTTVYPATGATANAVDSGQTTRHYASDGSSPTHDWEVVGSAFTNFEATCWQNIPGDELSIKVWGPSHSDGNCCWYIFQVDTGGKTGLGHENPHPSTVKYCI